MEGFELGQETTTRPLLEGSYEQQNKGRQGDLLLQEKAEGEGGGDLASQKFTNQESEEEGEVNMRAKRGEEARERKKEGRMEKEGEGRKEGRGEEGREGRGEEGKAR